MQQDKFKDINKSEVSEYLLNSFESFLGNFINNKDTIKGIISLCRLELEGKPKESDQIKWIDSGRRDQPYPPIKEYEVLSYQNKDGGIVEKAENGMFYFTEGLNRTPSLELQLHSWNIFSVRRLSDGEVFSIGDEIHYEDDFCKINNRIKSFEIRNNGQNIWLIYDLENGFGGNICGYQISEAKKILFTTQDGKEIYKGDSYYFVDKNFIIDSIQDAYTDILDEYKTFSNRKAAEEYINLHKQRFSLKDIHEAMFLGFNQTLEGAYEILKNKSNE